MSLTSRVYYMDARRYEFSLRVCEDNMLFQFTCEDTMFSREIHRVFLWWLSDYIIIDFIEKCSFDWE